MEVSTSQASCFLFTMHKAASGYVGWLIGNIFKNQGYGLVDICSEYFAADVNEADCVRANVHRMHDHGVFYGPFRSESALEVPLNIPARLIVHVRDPRDCLVSAYYSFCFSHVFPGPGAKLELFLAMRAKYRSMTIDEFCLYNIERNYGALGIMRRISEERSDAIISRYENMVTHFESWLSEIIEKLKLELNYDEVYKLHGETNFSVVEDPLKHKRQVTPGDFRRKLHSETQKTLTEFMEKDLVYFGYPLV
jgi:hypothetical protein